MKLIISFIISLFLIFSTPYSAFALSGDPTDFVKPKTTKIVNGKLVTQYDIQYKGAVKTSSGFLTKLEIGKLMAKGTRKYFPLLRALDLVDMALRSGLIIDPTNNAIYDPVITDGNSVMVIVGTSQAVTSRSCMEVFNWYLANNATNTTIANLVSCNFRSADAVYFLSISDVNLTSSLYDRNRPSSPVTVRVGTSTLSPISAADDVVNVEGQWAKKANDEVIGDLMMTNVPVSDLADMVVYTPEFQSPSAIRAIEAVKDEWSTPYEDKYEDVTQPQTGIGVIPNTEGSSSVVDEAIEEAETEVSVTPEGNFKLPSFCTWAKPVCDLVQWMKEPPDQKNPEDNKIPETPIDIDYQSKANENYVTFGGSCPADVSIPISLAGASKNIVLSFVPFCDFATKIRPAVVLGAWVSGLMIISGGRSRE